ncbi:MAG: MarR family transcriptional regulator [Cyclobacteriaceae bacterium]
MKEITGAGHYGFLIEITSKKIKQRLQQALNNTGIDITVDQWVVLDQLKSENGISQNVLGERIFKDPPTLTRIIDLMCQKGMIERRNDASDRRRFQIFLLEKGEEMIEKARPIVLETRTLGWEGLSADDYEALVRILTNINRNFENQGFFVNGLNNQ